MEFTGKKLDKNIPIPLYFQLKSLIVEAIKEGKYPNGSMIPTEKDFSAIFDISRTTVRQAITELVQEGWLYRVKSKGTFVSTPKISQDFIERLVPFAEQIKQSGKTPRTEVLEVKVTAAADNVAKILEIETGQDVVYLYRRRFADNEPMVTVETFLPFAECGFVMEHNLEAESLYDVMSETEESEVFCVKRRVEAVEANSGDTRYLNIKKGKPVQLFHSLGYNAVGRPVEYSVARYRGDRNCFEVTVFADKKK